MRVAYDKDYFLCLFKNIFPFPDTSQLMESTWNSPLSSACEYPYNVSSIYRIENVEQGIIYVSEKGKVNEEINAMQTTLHLRGNVHGHFRFDAASGMLIDGEKTLSAKGTVPMGHASLSMNVVRTTVIVEESVFKVD